ncbi:MAG: hypothetical protein VB050_04635 [Geobacteraceae bacterium]|nr:hypothetical protein [Geobacteraceae bacterium]
MKKGIVFGVMASLMLVIGAGSASAGWYHNGGIERREWRQEQRIAHGVHSGRLTPGEARRLTAQQERIRGEKHRMIADGHITARERIRLHNQMNVASRDIWRMNHNGYYR